MYVTVCERVPAKVPTRLVISAQYVATEEPAPKEAVTETGVPAKLRCGPAEFNWLTCSGLVLTNVSFAYMYGVPLEVQFPPLTASAAVTEPVFVTPTLLVALASVSGASVPYEMVVAFNAIPQVPLIVTDPVALPVPVVAYAVKGSIIIATNGRAASNGFIVDWIGYVHLNIASGI